MYKVLSITTALALALSLPQASPVDAQDRGNGNGNGNKDRGSENRGGGDDRGDKGKGQDRGERSSDRNDRDDRDDRNDNRAERRAERVLTDYGRDQRGRGDDDRNDDRRDGDMDRRVIRSMDDGRVVVARRDWDRDLITGCPPGLAKRDNGCLPPGQARKIARSSANYEYLWGRRDYDNANYRYEDGYLYRLNPQGSLLGYLPVLGGALATGNAWPGQYTYRPVADYQRSYFGLNDQYDYRYADGAVYGLDPKTQMISQVAALLTGQQFNVGQPMPSGYDVYNVPYQYRDQYADSAERAYRYNDGYVYQVDPTTQLVQTVIQLLT